MTGLFPFQIEVSTKFQRSYKLLLKRHCKGDRQKQEMIEEIAELVNRLSSNLSLPDANPEPLPKGLAVSDDWKFYKLRFRMPNLAGASGQHREQLELEIASKFYAKQTDDDAAAKYHIPYFFKMLRKFA